jgi:hypothetical protein
MLNHLVILFGPEQSLKVLEKESEDITWAATGVGFGIRGAKREDVTARFEGQSVLLSYLVQSKELIPQGSADIIQLYRIKAPHAPILFNPGPASIVSSVVRHHPLRTNCTDSPGKILVGMPLFKDIHM